MSAPVTTPGTEIANTASATWQQEGEDRNVDSNEVVITTTIFQTSAEIEFLRISNAAGNNAQPGDIQKPQCNAADLPDPLTNDGQALNGNENLGPASAYLQGDPVFMQVNDPDQNLDDQAIESVLVTLRTDNGDEETLRIYETGENTGLFAGYIQSDDGAVVQNNCVLNVDRNSRIELEYVDQFDSTEVKEASALVDPYGIVFDSSTGQPQDGVTVTLIDASNGQPATVFDDDGVTPYPSTVVTGDSAFGFGPGEYRFPLVNAGEYRLQLTPPLSYVFPSTVAAADLPDNPATSQPYTVVVGSYGENFLVPQGPPVRVDLPIDPLLQELVLEKTAQRTVVQQGDFLRYSLNLANLSSTTNAVNLHVNDRLPLGLRYQEGSARIDGVKALDPVIAPNGRDLTFEIGDLAMGGSRSLSYVVRISAGAAVGSAVNRAVATADGGFVSNAAEAAIEVEAAFQQGTMTLVGRVMETNCSENDRPARPVVGVRVYLENGRFAITDDEGKYHFEGLSARTHVVQVDQATLPPQYEAQFCYDDTRYAGTPFSRFVDSGQASLWRADFYVKEKEPRKSTAGVRLQSEINGDQLNYQLQFQVDEIAVKNSSLTLMLPESVTPVLDTARLDGKPVRIRHRDGVINVKLPQEGLGFTSELHVAATINAGACQAGTLETRALATFGTEVRKRNRTPIASNTVACSEDIDEPETYVYRPQFDVLSTTLKESDRNALMALAARLANRPVMTVKVRGHTDSDMIAKRNQHLYKNNIELGYARARSVADFLAQTLGIDPERIDVEGVGPYEQIATNLTPEGKAQNRRVEVQVYAGAVTNGQLLNVLQADSGYQTVEIEGKGWVAPVLWQPTLIQQPSLEALDAAWLNKQNDAIELLLPSEGYNPAGVSIPIAIKHSSKQRVQVELNGQGVSALNFDGQSRSRDRKVALSTWKGVDIAPGDNELVVHLLDEQGNITQSIKRSIRRSTAPVVAELLEPRSRLLIDGQQPPVIAIRLTDISGAPAPRGMTGEFTISSGQESLESVIDKVVQGVENGRPVRYRYVVADDAGTAFIRLSPATAAGRTDLTFRFADNRSSQISAWITEAPRDWILVGLAEGSLSEQAPVGSVQATDGNEVYTDGRIAFFAKGRVLGSALLTMRYDDNKAEAQQFGHSGNIDPDSWYTLYGDQSFGGQEGASQEQIYVRLERGAFHATYGDINTGLNVVELANYQRSLTGLQSELRGRYVSYNLFAAETETGFARDEIPGDGTSGYYRLSDVPKLNTEQLSLETRHRLRSHEVVSTRVLRRYYDYQINYNDGTVFFREPVPVRDADFNPVYIVANYEVNGAGETSTTAGGRVALHNASQGLMLGASYISEDQGLAKRSLVAADGRLRFGQHGELKVEYGETSRDIAAVNTTAAGKVIELSHRGNGVNGSIYFRELEAGYGLGSISASENATRKIGIQGEVKLGKHVSLIADAADEENLTVGNQRRFAELALRAQNSSGHVELGFRHAEDETAAGLKSESQQAILDIRQSFFNNFIGVSARYEAALSEKNAAADFPERVVLGFDVRVAPATLLFLKQEYTDGAQRDTRSTRVGLQSELWKGANLQSYIAQDTDADGQRLYTGNGLTQQIAMRDGWWASLGFDQSHTIRDTGVQALNGDTPLANGANDDFKSGHASLGRKGDLWHWDIRYEAHRSEASDRDGIITSWRRQNLQGKGADFALRWLQDKKPSSRNTKLEAQFGLVWRPVEAKWFFLNRFDVINETEKTAGASDYRSTRLVNQFNANWLFTERDQWSFFIGAKYVRDTIDESTYSGAYSQLGIEYRHSFNEWWDWGLQLSSHNDWVANNRLYSAGLNVGVSPLQNLWISLGYNWAGFQDEDFDEAAWTNNGAYIRFRLKFDQQGNGANLKRHQAMPKREEE